MTYSKAQEPRTPKTNLKSFTVRVNPDQRAYLQTVPNASELVRALLDTVMNSDSEVKHVER